MLELNCNRLDSKPSSLRNIQRSFNLYTSQVLLSCYDYIIININIINKIKINNIIHIFNIIIIINIVNYF